MPIPTVALERGRRFDRHAEDARSEDYHDILDELERDGELIVQRVPESYIEVMTKYGRSKKIPLQPTWHHKSCGQCGHIPGYSTAIFWIARKLGLEYLDPTDQTSCTAWNYYASATSNAAAQAAVAHRNFAAAYETGYYSGKLEDGQEHHKAAIEQRERLCRQILLRLSIAVPDSTNAVVEEELVFEG